MCNARSPGLLAKIKCSNSTTVIFYSGFVSLSSRKAFDLLMKYLFSCMTMSLQVTLASSFSLLVFCWHSLYTKTKFFSLYMHVYVYVLNKAFVFPVFVPIFISLIPN